MFVADLKVLSGKHHGKVITLNTKKFLVGRGDDCHMRPNNDLISRHHCIFTCDDYSVRLRDLGSTNGTFINNEQLRGQTVLKTGDQIRIGKLEFEVAVREEVAVAVSEESPEEVAEVAPVELPDDSVVLDNSTAETMAGSETLHEIPVVPPILPAVGETGVMSASETQQFAQPQQMPVQPPPLQYAPGAVPPGYAYPPQAMPPGYAPQAMPPGVMPPGQYPYPYPQQQQMPPGYPAYPAQPMMQPQMPGYPVAPVGQPEQAAAEPVDAAGPIDNAPVKLPEPSQTGVVEKVKAENPKDSAGGTVEETPSTKAGDIIQQMINRRPG